MENQTDDLMSFGFKTDSGSIIKVVGVGGGGSNAVNYMYHKGIAGVDFVICNTDKQSLDNSPVPVKIQLGVSLTGGKGAGNIALRGQNAAVENLYDVRKVFESGTRMVFLTAGMGGGTGTGAAPIIAQLAREMDILTIAVVTMPSVKEGKLRFDQANEGIEKLQGFVDSMLVISNENLHKMYGELPAREAFAKADDIVATAVKGCAEIITLHGNINIDFADVNTVMRNSGVFIMGTGYAEGNQRALKAVEEALKSPLLDSNDIYGSSNILLNITSGEDEVRMGEIGQIIDYLQRAAGDHANIIWGNGYDHSLGNKICVTIIATGFDTTTPSQLRRYTRDESGGKMNEQEDPERIKLTLTGNQSGRTVISIMDEISEMLPSGQESQRSKVAARPAQKAVEKPVTPQKPLPQEEEEEEMINEEVEETPQKEEGWINNWINKLLTDDEEEMPSKPKPRNN